MLIFHFLLMYYLIKGYSLFSNWFCSTNHKVIGMLYLFFGLWVAFFLATFMLVLTVTDSDISTSFNMNTSIDSSLLVSLLGDINDVDTPRKITEYPAREYVIRHDFNSFNFDNVQISISTISNKKFMDVYCNGVQELLAFEMVWCEMASIRNGLDNGIFTFPIKFHSFVYYCQYDLSEAIHVLENNIKQLKNELEQLSISCGIPESDTKSICSEITKDFRKANNI